MISTALRTDIERWAARRDENPIFRLARDKGLSKAMVTRYIANVTYMVRLTAGHLRKARDGARARGDHRLAAHYEHKLAEELGHHEWGEADLETLTKLGMSPACTSTTPAFERLARYLDQAIEEDPALYLPYLALTEYLTALLGPEMLELIETRTGVPRSSLTIIDNHIELDRDHAEEGWGCIDDLVRDPQALPRMRQALAEMLAHLDAFSVELTTTTEDDDGADREGHVSAA
jgi:hypothetical protein